MIGSSVAFVRDTNQLAIIIEPAELKHLHPFHHPFGHVGVPAQGFFFSKNVVSGQVDLTHRIKEFVKIEDEPRTYQNVTFIQLACEDCTQAGAAGTGSSVLIITSEYSDKTLSLGKNFHQHPEFFFMFETINEWIEELAVARARSLPSPTAADSSVPAIAPTVSFLNMENVGNIGRAGRRPPLAFSAYPVLPCEDAPDPASSASHTPRSRSSSIVSSDHSYQCPEAVVEEVVFAQASLTSPASVARLALNCDDNDDGLDSEPESRDGVRRESIQELQALDG